MNRFTVSIICLLIIHYSAAQSPYTAARTVTIESGENWFGGAVNKGSVMPFQNGFSLNLYGNNEGNQAVPLLLSTNGRYIWSDQPFQFSIKGDQLTINSSNEIKVEKAGNTLPEAFRAASKTHFPASGKMPDTTLFTSPQYNTWI